MTTLQSSVSDAPNCAITLCGLYYIPMTIVNDDSRVINKLETSLTDDARVCIYDCHKFIGHSYIFFFFVSDIKAK